MVAERKKEEIEDSKYASITYDRQQEFFLPHSQDFSRSYVKLHVRMIDAYLHSIPQVS